MPNDDYDEWIKSTKGKSNFGKLVYGVFLFFIFSLLIIFVYYAVLNPTTELESENTCMELMDMGFSSEQECYEFVQSLLNEIEVKLHEPEVLKFLFLVFLSWQFPCPFLLLGI